MTGACGFVTEYLVACRLNELNYSSRFTEGDTDACWTKYRDADPHVTTNSDGISLPDSSSALSGQAPASAGFESR